jgi:hypothetical protein
MPGLPRGYRSLHDLAPQLAVMHALRNPVGKNQNEKAQRQNPEEGTAHEWNMGKGRANSLDALAPGTNAV